MTNDIKNFSGEHNVRNLDGSIRVYRPGDVVSKKGKLYIAKKTTRGFDPRHGSDAGWEDYGTSSGYNFTNSETQPEISNEGDFWFDSSSGSLFIYIKDKDTEQWIEV
jgi:hypothetical protein